jgi:hypothetical protein
VTDPSDVPPLERAKQFRERAAQVRRDADRTTGAIRDGYLLLESGWLALADDVEAIAMRNAGDGAAGEERREAAFRPPKKSTDT